MCAVLKHKDAKWTLKVYGFTRMIGKIFKVILPYIVGNKVCYQPLSYIFYKFLTVVVDMILQCSFRILMPQYRQRNIILPKSIIFFTGRRMEKKIFLEFSTLPCPIASYCVMPLHHTPEHSNEFQLQTLVSFYLRQNRTEQYVLELFGNFNAPFFFFRVDRENFLLIWS